MKIKNRLIITKLSWSLENIKWILNTNLDTLIKIHFSFLYGTFNLNIFIELFQSPLNCPTVPGKSLYNPIRLTRTHWYTAYQYTLARLLTTFCLLWRCLPSLELLHRFCSILCPKCMRQAERYSYTRYRLFGLCNNNNKKMTTTTYLWFLCHSLFMRHGEVGAQFWEVGGWKVGRCRPGTYCLHSATIIYIWTWRRL